MAQITASRAGDLAARLGVAAAELIAVIERIDAHPWSHVPSPGVWAIGKDAEHVAEAAAYHQWIVRLTIRETVGTRRPKIERSRLTAERAPAEVAALIRERTEVGERLILGLSEEQLDLPTRPPRARNQRLAETIERVLIDHYHGHRLEIEAKLAALA